MFMSPQPQRETRLASLVIGRTILALVVAYIIMNLGLAVQKNVTINRTIAELHASIQELEARIRHLQNQIVYFQTDAYRTLEAKRRLGLKRPGERVVLVPTNTEPEPSQPATVAPFEPAEEVSDNLSPFEQASQNAQSWADWFLKR